MQGFPGEISRVKIKFPYELGYKIWSKTTRVPTLLVDPKFISFDAITACDGRIA